MKKLFYLLSSAALLFGAASCDKGDVEEDIVPEVKKTSIVLNASIADNSRTTLDGLKVDWAEGDYIYLVTSDETWGQPYVSSSNTNITTIASYQYTNGAFTDASSTELPALTEGQEYTVHAMYARSNQKSYHRGAASTHRLQATQSQDCSDPTAHIATEDALVGKFNITGGTTNTVDVAMSHIYTMMEVNIENTTGKEIEISKFEMEAANAALAGDFTVNYGNTAVAIDVTLKENTTGYDKITVNVTNGTVANNGTLPIYFVMAPLTDYSGNVTFTVTDSEGYTYTKTVAVEEISFEAGKYNTTGYTISEGVAPVDYSGTYVIMQADANGTYYFMSAENGSSRGNNRKAVSTGVTTLPTSLNSIPSMCNAARWNISKVEGGKYILQSADNEKYISGASSSSNYAKLDADVANAELVELEYDETNQTFKIISVNVPTKAISLNASYGLYAFYTTSYAHDLTFITANDPLLDMSVTSDVSLGAEAANGTVDINLANNEGWAITVSDNADWLTTTFADNQVNYAASTNTGDARKATVTLTATKNTESKVVTFVVSQDKAAVSGAKELTYTFTRTDNPTCPQGTTDAVAGSFVYTLDGVDYTFTTTKNNKGIYQNPAYLMLYASEFLGLPAISGYKLTKVVADPNKGASTGVYVGVVDTASAEGNVMAAAQQMSNNDDGVVYTYEIDGAANTVYYLSITNKSCQLTSLVLTYEPIE